MAHDDDTAPVERRIVIDGIAMVEVRRDRLAVFRKALNADMQLQALPRPAPPQEEQPPWWRRWFRWAQP